MYDYIVSMPEELRLKILWLYVPLIVIIAAWIIRCFVKNTLMVTGGVFVFFLLFVVFFIGFEDKGFILMAIYYYFVSYVGCFIGWIADMIIKAVRNRKTKSAQG